MNRDADHENAVRDYLCRHPEFFQRHPKLLDTLDIPHDCGSATSLLEYQRNRLQRRALQVEQRLEQLVHIARRNDHLMLQMQHLALALMQANDLDETIYALQQVLRDDFDADCTGLLIKALPRDSTRPPPSCVMAEADLRPFIGLLISGRPRCCHPTQSQRMALFDAQRTVRSAALIPLKGAEWRGVLGIGSQDPYRFSAGLGTVFLAHLGQLFSQALQPYLVPTLCQPQSR